MHTIIYLTGPENSGKYQLSSCIGNCNEIRVNGDHTQDQLNELRRQIIRESGFCCFIVVMETAKARCMQTDLFLKEYAYDNDLTYHNINLKTQKHGK